MTHTAGTMTPQLSSNPVALAHTGAVLAGGESRRMGAPKEGVQLPDGRPMIEHIIETMSAVCQRVVIVGACRGYAPAPERGIAQLPDLHPGAGPLAGIEALLASGLDAAYLVVSCDQPLVTPRLFQRLLDAPGEARFFATREGGVLHPFPGIFPAQWLPRVGEAVQQGMLSVRRLIEGAPVSLLPISPGEEALLRSINTPDDLDEVRHYAGLMR